MTRITSYNVCYTKLLRSFCAMGSSISKDVLPYLMVSGQPAKPHGINREGLRRRDFSETAMQQIKRAYKAIYMSNQRLEEALDDLRAIAAETPEVGLMVDFLHDSGRGIIR